MGKWEQLLYFGIFDDAKTRKKFVDIVNQPEMNEGLIREAAPLVNSLFSIYPLQSGNLLLRDGKMWYGERKGSTASDTERMQDVKNTFESVKTALLRAAFRHEVNDALRTHTGKPRGETKELLKASLLKKWKKAPQTCSSLIPILFFEWNRTMPPDTQADTSEPYDIPEELLVEQTPKASTSTGQKKKKSRPKCKPTSSSQYVPPNTSTMPDISDVERGRMHAQEEERQQKEKLARAEAAAAAKALAENKAREEYFEKEIEIINEKNKTITNLASEAIKNIKHEDTELAKDEPKLELDDKDDDLGKLVVDKEGRLLYYHEPGGDVSCDLATLLLGRKEQGGMVGRARAAAQQAILYKQLSVGPKYVQVYKYLEQNIVLLLQKYNLLLVRERIWDDDGVNERVNRQMLEVKAKLREAFPSRGT